ncbi:hypothetical protein M3Y99_00767900 [Aphelenchoides fujianensis]|nr:hypothetical protein M3Y99_00767900 [Aphelenchoides fujianensis]
MANPTDSYFRCVLGLHVMKAAYLIGVFGLFFELGSLIFVFVASFDGGPSFYHYVLDALSLASYTILMAAAKREKPQWMWVYLVGNTACTIVELFVLIAFLHYGLPVTNLRLGNQTASEQKIRAPDIVFFFTLLVTLFALINVHCISIVWRARRYLLSEFASAPVYHLTGSRPYKANEWKTVQLTVQKK